MDAAEPSRPRETGPSGPSRPKAKRQNTIQLPKSAITLIWIIAVQPDAYKYRCWKQDWGNEGHDLSVNQARAFDRTFGRGWPLLTANLVDTRVDPGL